MNGTVYEGRWKAGRYHGQGRLVTPMGEIYTGEFMNGKFMSDEIKIN